MYIVLVLVLHNNPIICHNEWGTLSRRSM